MAVWFKPVQTYEPGPTRVSAAPVRHPGRLSWTADVARSCPDSTTAGVLLLLQRTVGNAAVTGLLREPAAASMPRIQRQFAGARAEFNRVLDRASHKAALDAIQGLAMFDLLPKLQALPLEVRTDEEAGRDSGGQRLVTAMHAVAAAGTKWDDYAASHNAEMADLPGDQIGDIIAFLGGSRDTRYYKADEFAGMFDGSVDTASGVVTLFYRVRFDADGVRWGAATPGTPDGEREAQEGRQKFEADFKRVVEDTWSFKGTIKPACPIGPLTEFKTRVVVTVVPSGEHTLFHLFTPQEGRANAGPGQGSLKITDTEEHSSTKQVADPTGKHPVSVTTKQAAAAHEFGHTLGLHHPHCPGGDDVCYGVTAEERRDIMGAGNMLQVIKRHGKVVHDDFEPFERIAKRWGQDLLTGGLAKCNSWSAQ